MILIHKQTTPYFTMSLNTTESNVISSQYDVYHNVVVYNMILIRYVTPLLNLIRYEIYTFGNNSNFDHNTEISRMQNSYDSLFNAAESAVM